MVTWFVISNYVFRVQLLCCVWSIWDSFV